MNIKKEKGASAVEFAVLLPFLVLLLFGFIEFGIMFYDKAVITNASREGARFGILYYDNNSWTSEQSVKDRVREYCQDNLISFSESAVETTVLQEGNQSGDDMEVVVNYLYTPLVFPNLMNIFTVNLTAKTIMRME